MSDINLNLRFDMTDEMREEQARNRINEANIRRQHVTRDAIYVIIQDMLIGAKAFGLTGEKMPWSKPILTPASRWKFIEMLLGHQRFNDYETEFYYGWPIVNDTYLLTNGWLVNCRQSTFNQDGIWYEHEIFERIDINAIETTKIFDDLISRAPTFGVLDEFISILRQNVEYDSRINESGFFD